MTFQPKLSALTALLALTGALGLDAAHAAEGSLYDWQPCPDSLAIEGGEPPPKKWDLTISPFTHHWHSSNEHKPVKLIAMDSHLAGGRFCGLALFTNSFGQPSAYGYVGQQWNNLFNNPKLYTKVSAGFIYGYRGKYQDKIPFNHYGVAPAIIPAIGYDFDKNESVQAMVLGRAGILFAYGRSF